MSRLILLALVTAECLYRTCVESEHFELLPDDNNCFPGDPGMVPSSRSSVIKCALECIRGSTSCFGINFDAQEGTCIHHSAKSPSKSSEDSTTKRCLNYQKLGLCSSGFKRPGGCNFCLNLLIGLWNWSEARNVCNKIHSHPVVVPDNEKRQDIIDYLNSLTGPDKSICVRANPIRMPLWTAGHRSSYSLSFSWEPFPDRDVDLLEENLWYEGRPDLGATGDLCVNLWYDAALNDQDCSIKYCVLCEELLH